MLDNAPMQIWDKLELESLPSVKTVTVFELVANLDLGCYILMKYQEWL